MVERHQPLARAHLVIRRSLTLIAAGSMLALSVPAIAAAAPAASSPSFTATPSVATLVDHYTVNPTASASVTSSVSTVSLSELPELPVKDFARPSGATLGPNAASLTPNAIAASGTSLGSLNQSTPSAAHSFIGQQGSSITCSYFPHGCNPPDMAVASNGSVVFQGVNTSWALYDRNGNLQPGWPVSAQSFFGVPSNTCDAASGGQPFLSDPRAIYDPSTGRFWAAELQVEGAAAFGIAPDCPLKGVYYIAVSQTRDPSGAWNVYEFDMTNGQQVLTDYTQLGLNGSAVTFSSNVFGLSGGFYAEMFEANKAQMMAGTANFTADGFYNMQVAAPGPYGPFLVDTPQPVLSLAGGSGPTVFVDTVDGPDLHTGGICSNITTDPCSGLLVWSMRNPTAHDRGGPAPSLSLSVTNTVGFAFPPAADQPTCSRCIDGNDLRIGATPVLQDGILYTAWGTAIDNGSHTVPGIVWAQTAITDSGRAAHTNSGYYYFSGDTAATYPAVMPTGDGRTVMLYELMSSTVNPQTRYVVGEQGFSGPGRLLKAGEAAYRPTLCGGGIPVCRWGDYEATSSDGHGGIWFAGEYANSFTDPNTGPEWGRNWGTWIGSVNTQNQN